MESNNDGIFRISLLRLPDDFFDPKIVNALAVLLAHTTKGKIRYSDRLIIFKAKQHKRGLYSKYFFQFW